jgi:2-dehydro-3-deoxygalactonokinase
MIANNVIRNTQIIVDWGTSNFRAYRFGGEGEIISRHQANAGILTVHNGAFEEVLEREIGTWISPLSEILLSGMITSRNGWVETPYAAIPATLTALANHAVLRQMKNGAKLKFLPGVAAHQPSPDVMRGEEIQIFGVVGASENANIILPGTHSKWAQVRRGAITGFRTFLTGEMFAILKNHSILGRLIPSGEHIYNEQAFLEGVAVAQEKNSISFLNDIFTARSGVLLGVFPADAIQDRLSGMLIGHEIKAGLAFCSQERLVLVGEASLTNRYGAALKMLGKTVEIASADATVDGFRRLSVEASIAA